MTRLVRGVVCAVIAGTMLVSGAAIAPATEIGEARRLLTAGQAAKATTSVPVKVTDSGCWKAQAVTCYADMVPRGGSLPTTQPVPSAVSVFRHGTQAAASKDFQDRILALATSGDPAVEEVTSTSTRAVLLTEEPAVQFGWAGGGGAVDGVFVVTAVCSYGPADPKQDPVVLTAEQRNALARCTDALITAQLKKAKR